MARSGGLLEAWVPLHDRFRIEEQKSAVAAAIVARDPKLT
jgi:hypothetical protein